MTKPVITLKNVKHAAFASQETNCFEATVYVDGKSFCKVSNEGHGGPDSYWKDGTASFSLMEQTRRIGGELESNAVDTYEEAKAANEGKPFSAFDDGTWINTKQDAFESAVGEALTLHLITKDIKKAIGNKKRMYFKVPTDPVGELRYLSCRGAIDVTRRPKMVEQIRKQYPDAIILTGMPVSEIIPHWS